MKNPRIERMRANPDEKKRHSSRLVSFAVIAAVAVGLAVVGVLTLSESSAKVVASPVPGPTPPARSRFVATQKIVRDLDTGQLRMPNPKELSELVESLRTLTKRDDENLESVALRSGGQALDLGGGFAGTMLGKPKADGSTETRCVFTFDEAIAFMGLVEETN